MSWVAVGVAGASLIGGVMSGDQKRKDASDARAQALAQFANINAPTIESQQLALQGYGSAGTLTPEQEALINLGPSAMEGISLDPAMRQKQIAALEQMAGLANGVPQAGDLAGFEIARRDAAAYDQAKQGQILQEMQQRGQGGSGAELLARLKSSQSSADRLQQADLEQAKRMQEARMQALTSQSNMAGGLRSQDYGEQSNLAKSRDLISQFNAQNAQGVSGRNTGVRNNAQQMNLQNAQNLANMNTENANKQQIVNKGLIQQKYNNDLGLAATRSGQYGNAASAADNAAAQTAGMWASVGQGVGTAINAYNKDDKK